EWSPSPDGKIMAYAFSDGGSDWNIWHFRRVDDGTELPAAVKFNKFWPLAWAHDSSGVYYSRYPLKPGQNADEAQRGDDAGRPDIYYHKLDDAQSADKLVFKGYETNGVLIQDLRKPNSEPRALLTAWDALYNFIGSKGDTLYFKTTNG